MKRLVMHTQGVHLNGYAYDTSRALLYSDQIGAVDVEEATITTDATNALTRSQESLDTR